MNREKRRGKRKEAGRSAGIMMLIEIDGLCEWERTAAYVFVNEGKEKRACISLLRNKGTVCESEM